MVVLSVALECCPVQGFLGRRIGDRDDQPRTLLQAFAVEIDGAVFGDEPVDVVAGGYHACAAGQFGAIFEMPLLVTEGMAIIALPPFDSEAP